MAAQLGTAVFTYSDTRLIEFTDEAITPIEQRWMMMDAFVTTLWPLLINAMLEKLISSFQLVSDGSKISCTVEPTLLHCASSQPPESRKDTPVTIPCGF